MYCTQCGENLKRGDKFCAKCGTMLRLEKVNNSKSLKEVTDQAEPDKYYVEEDDTTWWHEEASKNWSWGASMGFWYFFSMRVWWLAWVQLFFIVYISATRVLYEHGYTLVYYGYLLGFAIYTAYWIYGIVCGHQLALESRSWKNIEQFQKQQNIWDRIAKILIIVPIGLILITYLVAAIYFSTRK